MRRNVHSFALVVALIISGSCGCGSPGQKVDPTDGSVDSASTADSVIANGSVSLRCNKVTMAVVTQSGYCTQEDNDYGRCLSM